MPFYFSSSAFSKFLGSIYVTIWNAYMLGQSYISQEDCKL